MKTKLAKILNNWAIKLDSKYKSNKKEYKILDIQATYSYNKSKDFHPELVKIILLGEMTNELLKHIGVVECEFHDETITQTGFLRIVKENSNE